MVGVSGIVTWKVNQMCLCTIFCLALFLLYIVVKRISFLYAAVAPQISLYPALHEKSAQRTYHVWAIFEWACSIGPVQLILEDNITIVTLSTRRSYFLKEMGGLENNEDILWSHQPAHLGLLDPGFGRKYLYLLCLLLRLLAKKNPSVQFPKDLI